MFTYYHCYHPETWEAQCRLGFVGENSGIRFAQSMFIDKELKFNELAKKDSPLYKILKEGKYPFYIDRLQGGTFLEEYPYDQELVDDLCQENFLGFQMHEWLSNYSQDIRRVEQANPESWTAEAITEAVLREHPFPCLFLESMNAKEMEMYGAPQTYEEFIVNGRRLLESRLAYTKGRLLTCNAGYMATKMELERGVKHFMPEIGAQINNTRIQMAYSRGMAKAYGVSFGTYYEPWANDPFSACCYQRDNRNEWGLKNDGSFPFETKGENGGSSRSLQNRLHIYSYVVGASFMAEEWGMCNTFYDWKSFEVSPYGKIKLDFLEFTRKYPNIGKMLTPIAAVLPQELDTLDEYLAVNGTHLSRPVQDEALRAKIVHMNEELRKIFCRSHDMLGKEHVVRNYIVPDGVDIVHEDRIPENEYTYLVDLTGNKAFAQTHSNCISTDEVEEKLYELLPCRVEGGLHYVINCAHDCYYLTIFNHSGVLRSVEEGERYLPEADRTVEVVFKNASNVLTKLEGNGTLTLQDGKTLVYVPAGGWFFGKFDKGE